MADSRSESIFDSVEEFWKIEMDHSPNNQDIKILTAGVNNMCSIAKCAIDLIPKKPSDLNPNILDLGAYLTYQRLVKVLDFVWKGAQSLNILKSDLSEKQPEDPPDTLDAFKKDLDTLKSNLPQEDIVENTIKIPNSSAIELLLELFYKTIPEKPENIYEFVLAFEAKFGKFFTEKHPCGLPRVVFICYVPGGMIATACAAKWKLRNGFKFQGVNSKLREMREKRFQSALTETAEEKFTKVEAAWKKGHHTISRQLEDERFEAFQHLEIQGGAFQVLNGAGSILKISKPCIKCRHLYHFRYIGQKAIDNRDEDALYPYRSCAEDLCHILWANNEVSDRKLNTSLC
ncbi:hypothetical protein LTS15_001823 [Exophiala xenobiotica]|nr:hypothetical protein LTS15_001823 [Exophiala xenobiotica]